MSDLRHRAYDLFAAFVGEAGYARSLALLRRFEADQFSEIDPKDLPRLIALLSDSNKRKTLLEELVLDDATAQEGEL
jgi:hypothetical protein